MSEDPGPDVRDPARPRCCVTGHEGVPAAAIGIVDVGDEPEADVPYCGACARSMIATGDYTVTQVLDAVELGSAPCPRCAGTGRHIARDDYGAGEEIAAARRAVREARDLITDFDDVPPTGLTPLFYAHAYWELRHCVDQLLALLQPEAPAVPSRPNPAGSATPPSISVFNRTDDGA